jgi:predicted dehydrogenase
MSEIKLEDTDTRLAMVGIIEGNGHPYSWSAIINGYDPERMAESPYPVIANYLGERRLENVSIPDATVTHIWANDRQKAENVAEASCIPHVVDSPSDVIGEVDGIIIPTDDGDNHVDRVQPFSGTNLPIFVDKPLATNVDDLNQFIKWHASGSTITSSSAMRYAPAVDSLAHSKSAIGEIRWMTNATHKTWQRYGIHALEPAARLFGTGFDNVIHTTQGEVDIFTISHSSGPTVSIGVNDSMRGGFSRVSLYATEGEHSVKISDTYTSFRQQLLSVINFIETGSPSVPFAEIIDLMTCIIAGRWSMERQESVSTAEVYEYLSVNKPV